MATAMQKDEATASENPTPARRRWENGLAMEKKNEEALIALLGVLIDEEWYRRQEQYPELRLEFPYSTVVFGRYAITLLAEVPLGLIRLRMDICSFIINAWIYCKNDEAEEFAETLRRWPTVEDADVAKILRKAMEDTAHRITLKISQFFQWADVPTGNNQVFRTMFAAMARQLTMSEVVCMGTALVVLRDHNMGPRLQELINSKRLTR